MNKKTIPEIEQKIHISISREHGEAKPEVEEIFKDLDASVEADYMRFSAEELAMQVTIFLSGAFVGGAAWDLFKLGIKKLFQKYPKTQLVVRDSNSIMYVVKDDFSVKVLVTPDRAKEFEHIKTLDDIIENLESNKDI